MMPSEALFLYLNWQERPVQGGGRPAKARQAE